MMMFFIWEMFMKTVFVTLENIFIWKNRTFLKKVFFLEGCFMEIRLFLMDKRKIFPLGDVMGVNGCKIAIHFQHKIWDYLNYVHNSSLKVCP